MSKRHAAGPVLALAGAVISSLVAVPVRAQLLWEGDPASGAAVFKNLNNDGSSTIEPANDPVRGMVWRYHKVPGSNRCENHGIRVGGQPYSFREGTTYYFGWWSKLSSLENNNANFQWKSYENHIQNFPVILKMVGGRMTLQYRPPGQNLRVVWAGNITVNTWYHYVLALHLSKDANQGWIELWLNGQQQMLTNGQTRYSARTYDSGNHNCPKWGIYGATGSDISNWIDDLKVGMSHAAVAPDSPGSPPAPDAGRPDSAPVTAPDAAGADRGGGAAGAGGASGSGGAAGSGAGGAVTDASAAGGRGGGGAGGAAGSGVVPPVGGGGAGGSGEGGAGGAPPPPSRPRPMSIGCAYSIGASSQALCLWSVLVIGALAARGRRRP